MYNEFIIKRVTSPLPHLMVHNVYMYLNSITFNFAVLVFGHSTAPKETLFDSKGLLQGFVILIIINNSLDGIMTSLFLKHFNSVLKSIAAAIDIVLTAILSCLVLGIPIYWNTIVAVMLMTLAIIVYVKYPLESSQKSADETAKNTSSKNQGSV